jgi:prepilin-type N-terminal cleavage/methylation domain-containing protein
MSRRQAGYTLIELITVIVILGVLGGFAAAPFVGATDMVKSAAGWSDLTEESRRISTVVCQELRMNTGHTGFTKWSSTDLGFNTVRSDSVRFSWAGAGMPLLAKYNTTTDTVSRAVDSLAFTFVNTVGGAASADTNTYNVGFYLRLKKNNATLAERFYVHLRN